MIRYFCDWCKNPMRDGEISNVVEVTINLVKDKFHYCQVCFETDEVRLQLMKKASFESRIMVPVKRGAP